MAIKTPCIVNQPVIGAQERLIGTILLGNNLVNILASALTTSLFMSLFGAAGVVYATYHHDRSCGDLCRSSAKTYAIKNPDRAALKVPRLFKPMVVLFGPVSATVERIVKIILEKFVPDDDDQFDAHEELRGAIDLHHKEGAVVLKHDIQDMLGGILDLKQLDIEDVMVHRTHMEAFNIAEPTQRLVDAALKSSFSRGCLCGEMSLKILSASCMSRILVRAYYQRQW